MSPWIISAASTWFIVLPALINSDDDTMSPTRASESTEKLTSSRVAHKQRVKIELALPEFDLVIVETLQYINQKLLRPQNKA